MHVELRNREGVTGEVRVLDGVAVGSNLSTRRMLADVVIVEPGTLVRLTPTDGDRYLRALPHNIAGSYLWANMISAPGNDAERHAATLKALQQSPYARPTRPRPKGQVRVIFLSGPHAVASFKRALGRLPDPGC
jgi:hypothetical protein